jgi:hypothetical protein
MKLVKYTLCDIELVMVDIEGILYCSTPQLENVFRCHRNLLNDIARRWRAAEFNDIRFKDLTSMIIGPKDLTTMNHCHKELADSLQLKRARSNTRLWSEDDVLGFCFHLRSDIARQCRAQFKEILKQHARRDCMPMNQVEAMVADFKAQIAPLQEAVEELMSERKQMASYAGKSLRLVRDKS